MPEKCPKCLKDVYIENGVKMCSGCKRPATIMECKCFSPWIPPRPSMTIEELLDDISYESYKIIELEERLAKIEQRLGISAEKQLD
jgi:hypothetical protein